MGRRDNISSFFCWYKKIDALLVYDVSNLWAEMESSRPNGTQHRVRGNKSALLLQQPHIRVSAPLSSRCAEDERVTSFSVFRHRASCHMIHTLLALFTDAGWTLAGVSAQRINGRTWKRTPLLHWSEKIPQKEQWASSFASKDNKCVWMCMAII